MCTIVSWTDTENRKRVKITMRSLVLMMALLWSGVSWWWYTCDIKGYCESNTTQVENKEKTADLALASQNDDKNKSESPSEIDSASDDPQTNTIEPVSNTKASETKSEEAESQIDAVVAKNEAAASANNETSQEKGVVDTSVAAVAETKTTSEKTPSTTTTESSDATQVEAAAQEQSNTDQSVAEQTDTTEDIVSEDDNDPKKIRIDKVEGSITANIQKARIYFPYNSSTQADLTGSTTRYFDQVVEALKADSTLKIQLTGHTDNKGQAKRNKALGLRRAETVKKIFIEKGVSAGQIKTDSKGEDKPISTNKTEAGRNKNRRVTVEAITE